MPASDAGFVRSDSQGVACARSIGSNKNRKRCQWQGAFQVALDVLEGQGGDHDVVPG